MNHEVPGFAERERVGGWPRPKRTGSQAQPWSGITAGYEKVVPEKMEALERQAESLISALKPDEGSICLRQNVFRFVEKLVTDCFSDVPVRPFYCNCPEMYCCPSCSCRGSHDVSTRCCPHPWSPRKQVFLHMSTTIEF
jgi:hypothetical protein